MIKFYSDTEIEKLNKEIEKIYDKIDKIFLWDTIKYTIRYIYRMLILIILDFYKDAFKGIRKQMKFSLFT